MKSRRTKAAMLAIALLSGTTLLAADGKALYEQHCAKCHGADGKGQTKMGKKAGAKDYSTPKAWEGLTDAAVMKTIKEGFNDKDGKVIMKPTEGVTDADARAILDHMKTLKK